VTDRRLLASNGHVAASYLRGRVQADRFTDGEPRRITQPVVDLCAAPDGARDRQLLLGAGVTVFDTFDGWSFVQAVADDYVGYVRDSALGEAAKPTHRVGTLATHAYQDQDIKSPDLMSLPFGAQIAVVAERAKFWETPLGYIPQNHLRPLDKPFTDPATIAQLHFGVPYLWGGNSTRGIDCSGLVAAALTACDISSPADSDLQQADLGDPLTPDAELQRGDLIFWQGHIGMMVDTATMIHANAHHMAVAYEPLATATLRISAQQGGPVTIRKRMFGLG
jgi:cell wall-associated NlpC family hydrolase